MASAAEGAQAKQNLGAALVGGLDVLSLDDEVTFTKYVRLVLPLDGFVFWVKANLTNSPDGVTMAVKGSLHYSTQTNQGESETEGVSTVLFTAESPVQEFNNVQPDTMWVADYPGDIKGFDGPISFAFNSRGRYYQAADLYHYSGTALVPAFRAQLIDDASSLTARGLFVSNSLPIWLGLNTYRPPYPGFVSPVTLYPSFLVPQNLSLPYGVVHIGEGDTSALQPTPWLDWTSSQNQLVMDRVTITLYGLDNGQAQTFLSTVLQFSMDYDVLGMMNAPVIRDEKRTASELGVVAQKKRIEFEVSYNQGTLRDIARAQIERSVPAVSISWKLWPPPFPPL